MASTNQSTNHMTNSVQVAPPDVPQFASLVSTASNISMDFSLVLGDIFSQLASLGFYCPAPAAQPAINSVSSASAPSTLPVNNTLQMTVTHLDLRLGDLRHIREILALQLGK